jgi:hypothetical protein
MTRYTQTDDEQISDADGGPSGSSIDSEILDYRRIMREEFGV